MAEFGDNRYTKPAEMVSAGGGSIPVLRSGTVTKQARTSHRNWKKRLLCLACVPSETGDVVHELQYYDHASDKKSTLKGRIPIGLGMVAEQLSEEDTAK